MRDGNLAGDRHAKKINKKYVYGDGITI